MASATGKQTAKNRQRADRPRIWTQNVQGLVREDKLFELFHAVKDRNAYAVCIQETWREGNGCEQLQQGDQVGIFAAGKVKTGKGRGRRGVGIILSKAANEALGRATLKGKAIHDDLGDRVLAVRLIMENERGEEQGIFLVSAYAPNGDSLSSQEDWGAFYSSLGACLDRQKKGDMLILGVDANASMGLDRKVCGSHGNPRARPAGVKFAEYLRQRQLASTAGFFRGKKSYDTWHLPGSNRRAAEAGYQIDHIITEQQDVKCVTNCAIKSQLVDSDHRPLCCRNSYFEIERQPEETQEK